MKTSNKLLIAAFLVFIISLLWYNFALLDVFKATNSAKPKDPYFEYQKLSERDFHQIEVNGATRGRVSILKGPYKVMINKNDYNKYATISQVGDKLTIDVAYPDTLENHYYPYYNIIIFCPKISQLKTTGIYKASGKTLTNHSLINYSNITIVKGFTQDSLSIIANNGSYVLLDSNNISHVRASIGNDNFSFTTLELSTWNNIKAADINVMNNSELKLNSIIIPRFNYHFSNTARVFLSGSSLNLLKPVELNELRSMH